MRLLHTSDWHLGQKFINHSRDAEHKMALDWLLTTLDEQAVDVLVVAGDIFDVNNPPVGAEEIYYTFLTEVIQTHCRHVVIVGGNHDLPSRLEAPSGLLRRLNVHVVGAVSENPENEIIELREDDGTLTAVVAAVPFLRDRDLKFSISGENFAQRAAAIQQGIVGHFQQVAALCAQKVRLLSRRVPVVATGHLFATGASAPDEQNNIYLGHLENIAAGQFPDIFDYVALGHIHRAQRVGKQEHIRYSGSLIPLSFNEISDKKVVLQLDFSPPKKHPKVQEIVVPVFRRLVRLQGSPDVIQKKMAQLSHQPQPLPAWLELVVEGHGVLPSIGQSLREQAKEWGMEVLKISLGQVAQTQQLLEQFRHSALEELSPRDIFKKRVEHLPESEQLEMWQTFDELMASLADTTNAEQGNAPPDEEVKINQIK